MRRIIVKGGIITPSELKRVAELSETANLPYLSFGSRQDILLPLEDEHAALVAQFPSINLRGKDHDTLQNIVCSYVSTDIFASTSWLRGANFLYLLEQFEYDPKLRINITDPLQRLVPLFSGHLNFIASDIDDYWYLYIRLPSWSKHQCFPVLIHSWDLMEVAHNIEKNLSQYAEVNNIMQLFDALALELDTNSRNMSQGLHIPFQPFPYYEGMNKTRADEYWLGVYWRNNEYSLPFLKAMCDIALDLKIGKICITPWKSFIIKGIRTEDRFTWEKFLGKSGINIRHSSLELNWHLPAGDQEALELKRFVVRNFDQNDISTYGLTFGITESEPPYYFTSIVIKKNPAPQLGPEFNIRASYNVYYARNFDPNERVYETYAQDIDKVELPGLLMELSTKYWEQLEAKTPSPTTDESQTTAQLSLYHQCQKCMTIYDAQLGDPDQGIPPDTPFAALPDTYQCALCQADKSSFAEVSLRLQAHIH